MKKYKPIIYKPLRHQKLFHDSNKPKVFMSAGYGAGKSHSLCMKMIKLASINKGLPGGLLVPNIKMFKRDILPLLRQIRDESNVPFNYNQMDSTISFPEIKSTIYVFHDEDKGQSIRGPNLAFMCINEGTLISKESFDASLARVRLKNANLLQVAMSGTPEGVGTWPYEYFIENPREDTDLIFGSSKENVHIHDSYFQMLEDSYDELMRQQFVDGKYININGRQAAWAFNRFRHVNKNIERDPTLNVWVSMDFNINPMAATLWNQMGPESKVKLRAFDEICLNTSNTYEIAQVLRERLGDTDCVIYPDPAGAAGSTKSQGKSDIMILKEAGFKNIKYKRAITSVRDCLNALNNMFSKDLIEIHPRCKNLIADLEQCIIKKDSVNLDKSNQKRTHWLDGLKDMVDYEFPIRARAGGWREVQVR